MSHLPKSSGGLLEPSGADLVTVDAYPGLVPVEDGGTF